MTAAALGLAASGPGAEPRILVYEEITVSPRKRAISESLQPSRLAIALEMRAKGHRMRAAARASGCTPDQIRQAGAWHLAHAAGLQRQVADRLLDCGRREIELMDKDTGEVSAIPVGCGQALCKTCRKKRAGVTAKRLREALGPVNETEDNQGRRAVLWTLTLRDSGDPGRDALLVREAWKLYRASWHAHYGFAYSFIRYEEITAGRSAQGHNHWHALVWAPPMGRHSLSRLNSWWTQALRTAARNMGVYCDGGALHVAKGKTGPAALAAYAGKVYTYISKESFELEDLEADKAASYLASIYRRRRFTTSRGLFGPRAESRFVCLGLRMRERPAQAPDSPPEASGGAMHVQAPEGQAAATGPATPRRPRARPRPLRRLRARPRPRAGHRSARLSEGQAAARGQAAPATGPPGDGAT